MRDLANRQDNLVFGEKMVDDKGRYVRRPDSYYDIVAQNVVIPDEIEAKVGTLAGYAFGDLIGHGSRSMLWNGTPQERFAMWSLDTGKERLDPERDMGLIRGISFGTVLALEAGSNNVNLTNIAEGGRPAGFTAVEPTESDPRQPVSPLLEAGVYRTFLGRRGRLLPWEEFKEERPDVSYETYDAYKDYLYGNDENMVRDLSLGLVSATGSGIDGPEARVLGFRITPTGAAAAAATTLVGTEVAASLLGRRRARVQPPTTQA